MMKTIGIILYFMSLLLVGAIILLGLKEGPGLIFFGILGFIFPYYFNITGIFEKRSVKDQLDIETEILEKKIEIQKNIRELEELENEN